MVEIESPEVVNTQYGKKLAFTVPKNKRNKVEPQVRNLDWDQIHYEIPENGAKWRIDLSFEAFEQVESETNLDLPRDYLVPEDATVVLRVPEPLDHDRIQAAKQDPTKNVEEARMRGMFIKFEQCPDAVFNKIEEEVTYEIEKYNQSQREYYTVEKKDLIFKGRRIPIGFHQHVKELLDEMGVDYTFIDDRTRPEWGQINDQIEWNFPYELRDYQKYGLSRWLKGSCVIQWPTGAGKTVLALRGIYEMGMPALILVNSIDLLEQWIEEIREILGYEPGVIQGDRDRRKDITVAMVQSVRSKISGDESSRIDQFDLFITDEVHHLPADTWLEVALRTNAYYRYGLSATLGDDMRDDEEGIKIIGGIGPNDISLSPERLIDEGYLAEPTFKWLYPPRVKESYDDWHEAYDEFIVKNDQRNALLVEEAADHIADGRQVLIDVSRVEHGEVIRSMFNEGLYRYYWDTESSVLDDWGLDLPDNFDPSQAEVNPVPIVHNGDEVYGWSFDSDDMMDAVDQAVARADNPVMWVYGEDDNDIREGILNLFRNQRIPCVVSTLLGEGINVPSVNTIILGRGQKSSIQLIQTVGRALRPENGKAIIVDCKDVGQYVGKHTQERVNTMERYYGRHFDNAPL